VIVGINFKELEKEEFVVKISRRALCKGQLAEKCASTMIRLEYSIEEIFIH
jgi:hypothetical protein